VKHLAGDQDWAEEEGEDGDGTLSHVSQGDTIGRKGVRVEQIRGEKG